jgi:hypothetical protein
MRRDQRSWRSSVLAAGLLLIACAPQPEAADELQPGARRQAVCGEASDATLAVFSGLRPHCAGCHFSGVRGYFASLTTFQNLVVGDPRLVNAADPDKSELVRLLVGTGTGSFKAMPTGAKSYPDLVSAGTATLTVDQIRQWMRGLSAQARSASPNPRSPRVKRLNAQQIQRTLYQQLGLGFSDFFTTGFSFGVERAVAKGGDELYPLQPSDALPGPFGTEDARDVALGGGSVIWQRTEDSTLSPGFLLTLTQMSQRWCRLSLAKPGNLALFPAGTVRTTEAANVKAAISRWFLRFHGTHATQAEVDALYAQVWIPVFTQLPANPIPNAEAGFTALCSSFIRHPKWIFY